MKHTLDRSHSAQTETDIRHIDKTIDTDTHIDSAQILKPLTDKAQIQTQNHEIEALMMTTEPLNRIEAENTDRQKHRNRYSTRTQMLTLTHSAQTIDRTDDIDRYDTQMTTT